jgi:hypothetical protein
VNLSSIADPYAVVIRTGTPETERFLQRDSDWTQTESPDRAAQLPLPYTRVAPATRSASAQATKVAPVVNIIHYQHCFCAKHILLGHKRTGHIGLTFLSIEIDLTGGLSATLKRQNITLPSIRQLLSKQRCHRL